jgi:hypothetical protein
MYAEDRPWDTPWAQPAEQPVVHAEDPPTRVTVTDVEVRIRSTIANPTAHIAEGAEVIAVEGTRAVATVDAKAAAETGAEAHVAVGEEKTNMPRMIETVPPMVRPTMM